MLYHVLPGLVSLILATGLGFSAQTNAQEPGGAPATGLYRVSLHPDAELRLGNPDAPNPHAIVSRKGPETVEGLPRVSDESDSSTSGLRAVIRMSLSADASPTLLDSGVEQFPGQSHYFIGNDPSTWRTSIPARSVRHESDYPGSDLVYYGNSGRELQHHFVIAYSTYLGGSIVSSKGEPQQTSAKAQPPLREPVRESVKRPADAPAPNVARLTSQSIKALMDFALRRFGWFENWTAIDHYEACLDRDELTPPEVYIELGMAYLTVGRFDSAIAILEKGKREVPRSHNLARFLDVVLAESVKVKATLTEARDSLRKQGLDVVYPHETIFAKALSTVTGKSDFLILNLADAYVATFPNSLNALRTVADVNLAFVEFPSKGTTVPHMRGNAAIHRGEGALEKFASFDKNSVYPSIRLMHHVLLTTERVRRSELPRLVTQVTSNMERNPQLTNEQKAFLYFGQAMFYLHGPSWGVPMADRVISWLEAATLFDREAEHYATALATVRANKDQINRTKLQARAQEDARSRELARRMFGGPAVPERDRVNTVYGEVLGVVWELGLDRMRQQQGASEIGAELFHEIIGCPACWGTGVHGLLSNERCYTCGGTGKR